MRFLVLAAAAGAIASASAQSASLGIDRKFVFTAAEYPAYETKAFHSTAWTFSVDGFVGTRVGGSKGLGAELALEKRFYTAKFLGLPLFSASLHFGVGPELFAGEKPSGALFLGISGRLP